MRSFLAALLLAAVLATHATYTGTWRDTDGRLIYLCETGDNDLQGSYSEVGFIQGTVSSSGQIARGNLYQAIHPRDNCAVRDFTLDHVSDQFRGEWGCQDDDNDGVWEATRVNAATPTAVQCAILATSGDLEGRWNKQTSTDAVTGYTLDICFDDDEFNNSYEYDDPGENQGYSYGELYENRRIGVGNYEEDNGSEGWDIWALLQDGSMLSYYWDITADDEDVTSLNNAAVHGSERFNRVGTTTQMQCRRNIDLGDDDDNGIDDDDFNFTGNNSPAPPSPSGSNPNPPSPSGPNPPSPSGPNPPSPSGPNSPPPPSPSGPNSPPPPSPSGSPPSPPPPPSPNSPPPPPSPSSFSAPFVVTVDPDSFRFYESGSPPSSPPPSPS
eukprot:TRINITY_DN226_c0_g1_i2.p1 TRINITY_DN226_c0_g1~~TRINITY_DN226_c0_g1_i2.p1  ORF type:complete len:383 (+),score=114.19 TRINITY_DN226_c0_g1_i2:19-1167(+)